MSDLFGPKPPNPIPVVDPGQTQNRMNEGLSRMLQGGGSNADLLPGGSVGPVGAPSLPTLTGLSR